MTEAIYWIFADIFITFCINILLWSITYIMPTRVILTSRLPMGALGLALPGCVFLRPSNRLEMALRHELVHQKQMRRYTPLGVALLLGWHYGRGFLFRKRISRADFVDLWKENPLEIEANKHMYDRDPLPPLHGWPLRLGS